MRIKVLLGLRPDGGEAIEADPIQEVFFRVVAWPMKVPNPDGEGGTLILENSEELEAWAERYFGKNRWDYLSKHISPEMIEAAQ
jgi:hypothetical protein